MYEHIDLQVSLVLNRLILVGRWLRLVVVFAATGFLFAQMSIADDRVAGGFTATSTNVPLDASVYTLYTLSTDKTEINWNVCGSLKASYGCYGAGQLGPFGKVGPVVEGFPVENLAKRTVTREIYVLDVAAGTGQTGVDLYVYVKTDHISRSYDNVTVKLRDVVSLPLIGGTSAIGSMAANARFIYVGTNQGPVAAEVTKKNLTVGQINYAVSPSIVSAITANLYGYVTLVYAYPDLTGTGSLIIAPDGTWLSGAGGPQFMLNPIQSVQPSPIE